MALAFISCSASPRHTGADATSRAAVVQDALSDNVEYIAQLLSNQPSLSVGSRPYVSNVSFVAQLSSDAIATMIKNAGCTTPTRALDGNTSPMTASNLFQAALLSSAYSLNTRSLRSCDSQLPFAVQRGEHGQLVDANTCLLLMPSGSQLLYESLRPAPGIEVRDIASVDALKVSSSPIFFTSYTDDWKRCNPRSSRLSEFLASVTQIAGSGDSKQPSNIGAQAPTLPSRALRHARRVSKIVADGGEMSLSTIDVDFVQRLRDYHLEVYGTLEAHYFSELSDFISMSENTGMSLCHGLSEWDALSLIFGFVASYDYGVYSADFSYGAYKQQVLAVLPLTSCLVECSGCMADRISAGNFVFSNVWIERFAFDDGLRPLADSDSLESAKRYIDLVGHRPARVFCTSFYRLINSSQSSTDLSDEHTQDCSSAQIHTNQTDVPRDSDRVEVGTGEAASVLDKSPQTPSSNKAASDASSADSVKSASSQPQAGATRVVRRRPIR